MIHLPVDVRDFKVTSALVAVLLVGTIGCQRANRYVPPPPPKVTVAHPIEKEVVDTAEYTGTTEAYEFVEIRARVKGFLQNVLLDPGADVAAGAQLYLIDPKPFQAAVDRATAAVALAKARVASANADVVEANAESRNAEAQYRRGYQAAQGGAVTAAELDDLRTVRDTAVAKVSVAQAAVGSAEAEVGVAEATLREAELNLGYTQVISPIDGRVGRTLVDEGNLVGDGEPTHLTTVVCYDPIYAYFNISETDLLDFMQRAREESKSNTAVRDAAKKQTVDLGLANEEGYPHQGHFEYADLAIDESTGTFLVRAQFSNPDRTILPGAFVRIRLSLRKMNALLIPDEAVGRDQGGQFALVVNSGHVVERRSIEVGSVFDGMRAVKKGLSLDDWVVVNGIQRATPGMMVTPEPAADETVAAAAPALGEVPLPQSP
jgi:RND family efflux transporter MFP subunit